MKTTFYVRALWDDDAKRWYSESDIDGLAIETDTLEEFAEVLQDVGAELVLANHYSREDFSSLPLKQLIPTIVWERPRDAA